MFIVKAKETTKKFRCGAESLPSLTVIEMFTGHGERELPGREVHMMIVEEAEKGTQLTSSRFLSADGRAPPAVWCTFLPQLALRTHPYGCATDLPP